MKLRVDRDVLAEAVIWTARSVPARPPVPVLAGILAWLSTKIGDPELACLFIPKPEDKSSKS